MVRLTVALLIIAACTCCYAEEMPLLVGGHAHGKGNIEALAQLGVGNFVWIPKLNYPMGNTPWDAENDILADVDTCVKHNMSFMISQRRGIGTVHRGGGFNYGGDCSLDLHSKETVEEIARNAGKLFVGLHAEELDADLIQSSVRECFMTRTPELYDFIDAAGGRACFERELKRMKDLYRSQGAGFLPNLCVTNQISGFRIGADIVMGEPLEHLPTTELQLAYLRGGSQQFGGNWGVWVSPWFWGQVPCEDKDLWQAQPAQIGGGHSASEFRRTVYLSYVSGARIITMQETEPIFSRAKSGDYELAAWGKEIKNFWDYAKNHSEPMKPIIPLAVMIDKDNGWFPKWMWQAWNWQDGVWGKLPVGRGDKMLPAYFDMLLPGFERTRESVMNKEDIYPGFFAATPYGPFDIVASDISADKLADYPVVMLLGQVDLKQDLLETLKSYVGNGGTLVVNVLHMRDGAKTIWDEEFLGSKPATYIYASCKSVVKQNMIGVDRKEYDEPCYCMVAVEPTSASAVVSDDQEHPVVLKHEYGKGRVYLTTPEYMLEGFGERKARMNFFSNFLGGLMSNSLLQVNGTDLSSVAAYQGTDILIALANHSSRESTANVTWKGKPMEARVEIGNVKVSTYSAAESVKYSTTIPGEDIVLLRLSAN